MGDRESHVNLLQRGWIVALGPVTPVVLYFIVMRTNVRPAWFDSANRMKMQSFSVPRLDACTFNFHYSRRIPG